MQSDKQVTNKLAMSRALGAAFLSHQVEQLEKSVGRESRGTTSNNWRERNGQATSGRGGKRGAAPHTQNHQGGRKKERKDGGRDGKEAGKLRDQREVTGSNEMEKDADTVVVDASVLVHALGQLKRWCKDGRQEVILIPLEALNTLDLLKKGSTPLAQRARAASRILESQVGTNSRIRVQRDDAFVLWDEIPFRGPTSEEFPSLVDTKVGPGNIPAGMAPPPEWLRRTICCGRWEVANVALEPTSDSLPAAPALIETPDRMHARSSTPTSSGAHSSHSSAQHKLAVDSNHKGHGPRTEIKVVLAVVANASPTSSGTGSSLDTSMVHPGRYERADGSLVRIWAQRAGIEVLDIEPTVMPPASLLAPHQGRSSPERRRPHPHVSSERRDFRDSRDNGLEREGERRPSLVEKPIAMSIVNEQPVKALRVLARGEKLDP